MLNENDLKDFGVLTEKYEVLHSDSGLGYDVVQTNRNGKIEGYLLKEATFDQAVSLKNALDEQETKTSQWCGGTNEH